LHTDISEARAGQLSGVSRITPHLSEAVRETVGRIHGHGSAPEDCTADTRVRWDERVVYSLVTIDGLRDNIVWRRTPGVG